MVTVDATKKRLIFTGPITIGKVNKTIEEFTVIYGNLDSWKLEILSDEKETDILKPMMPKLG